ncbi:MAG: hypothetical protein ACLGI6_09080 [Gammaproteobacteria bacterium]
MDSKNSIFDLVSLLKVFDANYVSDEECEGLYALDANNPADVALAVDRVLLAEFRSYPAAAKSRMLQLLRSHLDNPREDFDRLFDRVDPVFESGVADKRAFMKAVLKQLESTELT